jgi:hypothetical protein
MKQTIKAIIQKIPPLYNFYLLQRKKIICNTPSEQYIQSRWQKIFDKELNLQNPKTYNEKLQWGKIFANNPLAKKCADKIEVLEYVRQKVGSEYINKLIATYPNTKNIDFSRLPNQFVLKATHDSGSVLIVKDRSKIDFEKLKEIEQNLKINYGHLSKEWVYDDIKPKIIIEKFLESEDGKSLKDYKIFCFNGEPKIIQVDLDRFEGHKRNFYDTSWNRLDLEIEYLSVDYDAKKPDLLDEMLEVTRKLAKPFNHVRVDWYICENRLVFGEMTFFHGSGFEKFNSQEWEEKMGSWFEVSKDLSY